jgi:hypothetical protein
LGRADLAWDRWAPLRSPQAEFTALHYVDAWCLSLDDMLDRKHTGRRDAIMVVCTLMVLCTLIMH